MHSLISTYKRSIRHTQLLRSSLASRVVIEKHRLTNEAFNWVLGEIESKFHTCLVNPCEMVRVSLFSLLYCKFLCGVVGCMWLAFHIRLPNPSEMVGVSFLAVLLSVWRGGRLRAWLLLETARGCRLVLDMRVIHTDPCPACQLFELMGTPSCAHIQPHTSWTHTQTHTHTGGCAGCAVHW